MEATQQQHSIGNKLIADFDYRLEHFPPTWIYQEGYRVRVGYSGYSFAGEKKAFIVDHLRYHESWDWLMPVVAKIYKDTTAAEATEHPSVGEMLLVVAIKEAVGNIDIGAAWEKVVEYLEKQKIGC